MPSPPARVEIKNNLLQMGEEKKESRSSKQDKTNKDTCAFYLALSSYLALVFCSLLKTLHALFLFSIEVEPSSRK